MADVGDLFDLLAASPDGLTIDDIAKRLHITKPAADRLVHDLRIEFEGDTINVPATPNGQRERWLYKLVGDWDHTEPWVKNRLRDLGSRVRTATAIAASLVHATDGRSVDGRKARKFHRVLSFLKEELAEIEESGKA